MNHDWMKRESGQYSRDSDCRAFLSLVSTFLLSFTLAGITFPAHAVFTTPGQFSVGVDGSANYSIPIVVPPGTAGIQPMISLEYNSNGGNGIVGWGWGVDGLSQIGRCPKTSAQDGTISGINYDANDRYCIDGQRLISTSTPYGGDGTEYRTELANFARIVSYGVAGHGPAWFKVWTKGGQVLEYGNTEDSRIEASGIATVRTWGVNRVGDTRGNYLTVKYTENNENGEAYVTRIDYTGNATSSPALTPYASVRFVYEARPDVSIGYQAGSVIKASRRMTNIKTYNGATLVKDYRLAYQLAGPTSASQLISLTQCDESSNCLKSLDFVWNAQNFDDISWKWTGDYIFREDGWTFADFFGDGRPIYHTHADGIHKGRRLNSDGTIQSWTWNAGGLSDSGWTTTDLFGDGRQVYYTHSKSGDHYASQLNSDGTKKGWKWVGGHGVGDAGWAMADLFGDGRQVYYTHSKDGTHFATRLNPDGTVRNWTWTNGHGVGDSGWKMVDLFGEGRQVYYTHSSDGKHFATQLNEDGTTKNWMWSGGAGVRKDGWTMADLFGDGKPVYHTAADGVHQGTRLNYDGTLQNWTWSGHGLGNGGWTTTDIFGDGRQLYYTHSKSGDHFATRLNADGTSKSWQWVGGHGVGDGGWSMSDLFGDGRQVYFTHSKTNGEYYATAMINSPLRALKEISEGGARRVTLSYVPLTEGGVYTKDSGAVYPVQEVQAPAYVVSAVSVSDGIGGIVRTTYQYGGMRADVSGRGNLGFRWMKSTNTDNGLSSTTFNRQDFPYIGLPALIENRTSAGVLLSQTQHTYLKSDLATGAAVSRFPYVSQTLEEQRELDGSLVTTTTTTYKYDAYGNATQVKVTSSDGHVKTTNSIYQNDTDNWYLGRLLRASVISTSP